MIRSTRTLVSPVVPAMLAIAIAHAAGPALAADDPMVARAGDGYLALRLEGATLVLGLLDGAKKPVTPKQATATMFLTYPDGHKSKVELKAEGADFKAPLPADAHGRAHAVAKVVADGTTYQASFDFDVPGAPAAAMSIRTTIPDAH